MIETGDGDGCQTLTLFGLGTLNSGDTLHVIVPFDRVEPLSRPRRPRLVSTRAWRRRCRTLLAEQGPAVMLRTMRDARVDLLPHQLEPAIAIVSGAATRMLIADDVGLGKTVQAGLIVSELQARGAAQRVLVLTPPGLRDQWAGELADRFGIAAAIVDRRDARQRAAALPVGLNPWSTVPIAIASIDYVKRPEVLPSIAACRWDIVVVDEAHWVAPGSDRRGAVATLCGLAPYVVLLTATPHNGDRTAFLALCDLGARRDSGPLLLFRRTRRDLALDRTRRVHRRLVTPSRAERQMHALLARFTRAVRAEHGDADRDVWLTLTTLHKRALSSAHSLARSVARRLTFLSSQPPAVGEQLGLPLANDEDESGELDPGDEPPPWPSVVLSDPMAERRMLAALSEAARAAATAETKLAALDRLIERLSARHEPALVFTEYRDTLLHVRDRLGRDCALLHGGLSRAERRTALEDFSKGRHQILLATDAGGEGLNLQAACRVVINLELPWNPMRLEQRIGRVDRIGQRRTVHAFHLVARGTGEVALLEQLRTRIGRARADIKAPDPLGFDEPRGAEDEAPDVDAAAHFVPVRLAGEAAAEQARLVTARAFSAADAGRLRGDLDSGPSIGMPRHPDTRRQLASRILVVRETLCEDGSGRRVAARLTPLLVNFETRLPRRRLVSDAERLLRDLEVRLEGDGESARWREETERAHHAFWGARLQREEAIRAALAGVEVAPLQPGLFDRRAEQTQEASLEDDQRLAAESARHMAAAERAAAASISTQTAIMLVP